MFYTISWFVVAVLLALWSLAAWALNAVAVWSVSNADALSGVASGAIRLPDWLAPWVPPEITESVRQMLAGLGPMVDSLLQAAPELAGGLTVAAWVFWGIGSAVLLILGAKIHLLISQWLNRGSGRSGPNAGPSLAAS